MCHCVSVCSLSPHGGLLSSSRSSFTSSSCKWSTRSSYSCQQGEGGAGVGVGQMYELSVLTRLAHFHYMTKLMCGSLVLLRREGVPRSHGPALQDAWVTTPPTSHPKLTSQLSVSNWSQASRLVVMDTDSS